MKFINKTNYPIVSDAIKKAEELLTLTSPMMDSISKHEFKYDSGSSANVVNKLLSGGSVEVEVYTPWRFSKAVGMFDGKKISISTRALNWMKLEDVVGLLLHEYSHFVGFTHGNNYPSRDKDLYSVPYYISSNIKLWL